MKSEYQSLILKECINNDELQGARKEAIRVWFCIVLSHILFAHIRIFLQFPLHSGNARHVKSPNNICNQKDGTGWPETFPNCVPKLCVQGRVWSETTVKKNQLNYVHCGKKMWRIVIGISFQENKNQGKLVVGLSYRFWFLSIFEYLLN